VKLWTTPKLWIGLLAIVALGAAAYANSLTNDFQFDDIDGIVRSPILRDARNIPSYFTDVRQSVTAGGRDWRPMVLVTLALDYAIDGLNPVVFRLTNLAIHIATACLIFIILLELFRLYPEALAGAPLSAETAAAAAGALFVVHPVNSEIVNHIWARSSALAALFYLLSFYCFMRGPWSAGRGGWRPWGFAGLGLFAVGLSAKATVITLPAALLLYEVLCVKPEKRFWREPRRLAKYLPVLTVSAAYVLFRFMYVRGFFRRVTVGPSDSATATYLWTQFRAWIYYIRLFIWPSPLIADYPGFGWSHSLTEPRVLLSLVLVAGILALAWRARKNNPLLTFFIFWFFVLLLPEASFIPLYDAVNGYRAYPAYTSLAVVALLLSASGAAWMCGSLKHRIDDSRLRAVYGAAAAAVLVALSAATIVRNRDWKDAVTLWSDTAKKDPTNARAYTNLAFESMLANDYSKADEFMRQAIALAPAKALPYMYRGYLSLVIGRGDLGLADFNRAIELDRRVPKSFYYRGEVFRKTGEYEKALADYRAALTLSPLYSDPYIGMALVHLDRQEIDRAIEACRKVMEVDAADARSYHCLGSIFLEQRRNVEAIRAYQRGLERRPRDRGLWYGLGTAYEAYGMYKPAAEAFDMASRLTK